MRRLLICAVLIGLALLAPAALAQREPVRLALVIGNKGYVQKVGPLKNPHNDVDLVATSLKRLGFTVTVVKDATYKQMDTAVKRHATAVRRAGPGAINFFYYSGHGVSNPETGVNYLIPVDLADADDDKVWHESLQQSVIIDLMSRQAGEATHYLVFDACRNELNVGGAAAKALGGQKGFAPVNDTSGLLVAYATAPRRTASDAGDGGGPYAKVLAEELVRPGIEAVSMFRNVQIRVKQSIGQDPWLSFPSLPAVYLAGRTQEPQPAAPPPAPPQAPVSPAPSASPPPASGLAAEAMWAWDRVKDSTSEEILEAFIRRYGDTFHGDLARIHLRQVREAMERQRAEAAAKAKAEEEARAKVEAQEEARAKVEPEPQRIAMLPQQQAEGKKAEEEARRRAEAEARRLEEAEAAARKRAVEEASGRDPALTVTPGSGKSFRDNLIDGKPCPFCPEMVVVPAGRFTMGSPASEPERSRYEGPQRQVTIGLPFAVGKFEVTFAEWAACQAEGGCQTNKSPDDRGWGRGRRPVINVSWNDAKEYVAWLSAKTGKTYRLLNEAEWEYAARAGTSTRYSFGNTISKQQAQYSEGDYGSAKQTVEVGQFAANAFGLHDMHGNVWEWVEDNWHLNYNGAPVDGSAQQGGDTSFRVLRGGSWYGNRNYLRSANRYRNQPSNRNYLVGFRLARTL